MKENYQEAQILDEETSNKQVNDTLENLVANMGTSADKRTQGQFINAKQLSSTGGEQELSNMYRTDWLTGKTVDIIPDDMTREWRSFVGDMEPDKVTMLEDEENRLNVRGSFNFAHKWARLYGNGFIVMNIDDGGLPEDPLNIDKIKPGGLKHIKVIDRHRLDRTQVQPVTNPLDENFGMPEFYRLRESNVNIHHSRLIRFEGILLPYDEFRRNNYFSDSVVARLYDSITNFTTAVDGSASMIYETNVDVIKVKGLMNYLQSANGEELIRKRFAMAKLLKSFNNMTLLDAEEDFENKTNTFSGLPDLIDRFIQILSAATDIPATRLLGDSPSGLNATGEGDLKNYYDMIRSKQITDYKPKLDYFDQIMAKSLQLDNEELKYEFDPLFQMTPQQQADLENKEAQTAKIYYDMGVLDELVIAKELKQKDTYTNIDEEYIKEIEEAVKEAKEFEQEMRENGGFNTDPNDPENKEQQNTSEQEEQDS